MTDDTTIGGAGARLSTIANVPVFVHFSEDTPAHSHPVMMDSYKQPVADVMNAMRKQFPEGGWPLDLDAPDVALCQVVHEEHLKTAVTKAFKNHKKANLSDPLTKFVVERCNEVKRGKKSIREKEVMPPRFVVVGSALSPIRCKTRSSSLIQSIPQSVGSIVGTLSGVKRARSADARPNTRIPLPDEHAVVKFYDALMNAVPAADGHIQLPSDVSFLSMRSNVLFVRDFYAPFFEGVLQSCRLPHPYPRIALHGTPGIGKSAFGMYVLYRCLRDGRTVVYRSSRLSYILLFQDGEVFKFGLNDVIAVPERRKNTTVYISDGVDPGYLDDFTILIAPPKRSVWLDFSEDETCDMAYFPAFSLKEMLQMRDRCFSGSPSNSDEAVVERMRKWGGVPRYVLAQTRPHHQQRLVSAIYAVNLDRITEMFISREPIEDPEEFYSRLFHVTIAGRVEGNTYKPTQIEYYQNEFTDFATEYVQDLLYLRVVRQRHRDLLAVLDGSCATRELAVLRARLLESHAKDLLKKGAKLPSC